MNIMTCFIDTSAWVAIVNEKDEQHQAASLYFKHLLETNTKIVTNNVAIDAALIHLKTELGKKIAQKFFNIIDESILTVNLRSDWISRRLRRNALNQYLSASDNTLELHHFLVHESIKRKNVDILFSFDQRLLKFGLPVMPQMQERP